MSTAAGIDIGSEAIKGVALKAGKSGKVEVIAAGSMPIADLTRLPEGQDRSLAIGMKLRELVKTTRLQADTRRIGASGGNTSIRYLQIPPVPPWRLEMLVKYEVEERSEEKEPNCSDFHVMDVPETNGHYTVIIGMCREAFANELLAQSKAGGLGEVEIDLESLALYAAYYHGHGFDSDKTVGIVDVGADDVTVLICKNGALYYARTMLGGGRRFTQNLADDLKLEWADADDLKKTTAEIVFDVTPAASSTVGRPRLQRPGGGTMSLSRPGMPGVSGTGLPARSGVSPAGASATGDEARRARVADGAKLVSKSTTPGVPATAASASSTEAAPVTKPAQSTIKLSSELDFTAMLDLDADLSLPPSPAPGASAIAVPAVIKLAPVAAPAPVASKPSTAMDEFELQPSGDEKESSTAAAVTPPATPAAPVTPVAAVAAVPAPKPLPGVVPPGVEIIDLIPLGDAPKSAVAPVPTILMTASAVSSSAPDMMEIPQSGASTTGSTEEKDRRRRQTTAALVREAASLCAAIENVLLNAKQTTKQATLKLDRLYITGGGSKLKGLSEFMSRRLKVEVAQLEPLRNLSLAKLPPAAADALRDEQHTLSVALGLALSDLRKGAFNFQLLPQPIKDRQDFWARGAYHYYAAGAAALVLGLLVYTPYTNTDAINANYTIADDAAKAARVKNEEVRKLQKENEELRQRFKTITDNIQSGDYFLTLFAELKSKNRIQDDVFLTSVSTSIPAVVIAEADSKVDTRTETNKEPDTFQAQRRVYLRGFARGKQEGALIKPIQDFFDKLVPFPKEPDHPDNLFKDIRPIWYSKYEVEKDGFFLKEFVLEAYTAAPAKETLAKIEEKKVIDKKGGKPEAKTSSGAIVTTPAQPAPQTPTTPIQQPVPQQIPQRIPQPVPPPMQQPIPQPAEQVVQQPTVPATGMAPLSPAQLPGIRGLQNPAIPVQPVVPGVQAFPTPAAPQAVPQPVPAVPKRKPVYVVPDDQPPPVNKAAPQADK
ncbi:MAG: pilus assembly protein PilM [Planctomycetota bacterium]